MTLSLKLDSLVCLQIPSALFSFPHSSPPPSFLKVSPRSLLISGGLILRGKPSAQGLWTNYQRLLSL